MKLQNGFILPIFTFLVAVGKWTNAVEYFKDLLAFCLKNHSPFPNDRENLIARKNIGIDLFLVLKWGLIACFVSLEVEHSLAKYLTIYLIWTNLFTYFYYHAWGSTSGARVDVEAQRRRFVNFLLSISFYIFCYAYLYQFHWVQEIEWPDGQVDLLNSIYLSVANAFTLTYGGFLPLSQGARLIFLTELVNTFFFFTIIVANSVPAIREQT